MTVNFMIGDFVKVCTTREHRHKSTSEWIATRTITTARSDRVYEVEITDPTGLKTVHKQRLVHYPAATAENDVAEELKEYAALVENAHYLVKELCDVRYNNEVLEVLVG